MGAAPGCPDEEGTMATLSVWRFDTATGADEAIATLERLASQRLITVHDAATVSWPRTPRGRRRAT